MSAMQERKSKVFRRDQLFSYNHYSSYEDDCSQVDFLLGGIGTGNISVGARGQLRNWEIFGTAGKGNYMPNGFFAIWAKPENEQPAYRVLESRLKPPFPKARGFVDYEVAGLPRFERAVCQGKYPFFQVDFLDDSLPYEVSMESFTPFIPLNAEDSGLPAAILRYRVKNRTDRPMKVSVAGSISNMTSLIKYDKHTWENYQSADEGVNEYREDGAVRGLYFRPKTLDDASLYYGTMALTTTHKDTSYKRAWLSGGWWDGLQDMWDDFTEDGRLEAESVYTQKDVDWLYPDLTGSLALHQELGAYEEKLFEFQISWYYPNRVNCWSRSMYDSCVRGSEKEEKDAVQTVCDGSGSSQMLPDGAGDYPTVKKHYAGRFQSAWEVASYTFTHLERLEHYSRAFTKALYTTTLPDYVIESVANNITVIRSNTCFWLIDGKFMAWEGCFDDEGCCEGSCTHVWNYAQTMAFLFPELERQMHRIEYTIETEDNGKMNFRTYKVFGMGGHDHVPAADGQMGTIVRLYREWMFSGDDEFLKEMWKTAKKTLDFAFEYWDKDKDFVFDTNQFNTYDIAFQGPSSMVNSLFFAALKAGSKISEYLGDMESARRYKEAFEIGSRNMDAMLWGGEYYVQKLDDLNEYRYQYGKGCLSDQVFGQTLAHLTGLGYVLPKNHVKQAVKSIFDYNFREDFTGFSNPQRTYVLNDETGLVLCSWNGGGRPRLPFPYSDEVWTGIEYQVAANLIYENYIEEGLTLVRSIRNRQNGIARNPWNEVECGHHYARSLASYGVYLALCGYTYNLPEKEIAFSPRLSGDHFSCFFSTGNAWGIYKQIKDVDGDVKSSVETLYGSLEGVKVNGAAVG